MRKTLASIISGICMFTAVAGFCQDKKYDLVQSTQPAQTEKIAYKKPSLLNHLNPLYTYKNESKKTNLLIKAGKVIAYALAANELAKKPEPIDPYSIDSDSDGIPDGAERKYGLNPYQSNIGKDTDNDGYDDVTEYKEGSHPNNANSKPQDDAWTLSSQSKKSTFSVKSEKAGCKLETCVSPNGINFAIPLKNSMIHGSIGKNYNINFIYFRRFR